MMPMAWSGQRDIRMGLRGREAGLRKELAIERNDLFYT